MILGIGAIDIESGLTNSYLQETQTDRAILQIGRKVILAADHTKCNRVSTTFVAPVSAVDIFVTDKNAPADFVGSLTSQGIQVISA